MRITERQEQRLKSGYSHPVAGDTRQRMVTAAGLVIGAHGVEAMSLRRLASKYDVPKGSIYHYFPGGKKQLVDEAVRSSGDRVLALIRAIEPSDLEAGVTKMMQALAWVMDVSHYSAGCPVAAAVSSEDHRATAQEVFDSWHRLIAERLADMGLPTEQTDSLATTFVAAVEGAILMARIEKSSRAFDQVGAEFIRTLQSRL